MYKAAALPAAAPISAYPLCQLLQNAAAAFSDVRPGLREITGVPGICHIPLQEGAELGLAGEHSLQIPQVG